MRKRSTDFFLLCQYPHPNPLPPDTFFSLWPVGNVSYKSDFWVNKNAEIKLDTFRSDYLNIC